MLLYKSLFIALALLTSSPVASASYFKKTTQQKSSSSSGSVLDYLSKSDVAVNVHVGRKDPSGLYRATVKRVYKGCGLEQYDTILIDAGSGDSYNGCGPAELTRNFRYVLFGRIAHRDSGTGKLRVVVRACRTRSI
jgi:hypothetical protein